MATVREFSSAGPCIELGELVERTASTVTFRDYRGRLARRGGYRLQAGLIHTEPCKSCQDHPQSSYPDGYMD